MRDQRRTLWRDGDFLKLWLGETISVFGSQITTLALPRLRALPGEASAEESATIAEAA